MYLHWPITGNVGHKGADTRNLNAEAYQALEECVRLGKIRAIGLSNYRIQDYEALVEDVEITVPPAVNQFEVNPFQYRKATIDYFTSRGIAIVAYRSLVQGSTTKLSDPVLQAVAKKHGQTASNVLLR